MIRLVTLSVLTVVVTACQTMDRGLVTDFTPLDDGRFRYVAKSNTLTQPPDERGEPERIAMLEDWLSANARCPDGYEITNREVLHRDTALLARSYDVIYVGRCL